MRDYALSGLDAWITGDYGQRDRLGRLIRDEDEEQEEEGIPMVTADRLEELAELGAPEQREAFRVTDLGGASWAMRKLHAIRQKQAEVRQVAEAEIARVQAWADQQTKAMEDNADYFVLLLVDYHRNLLAEDERAKTVKLPHGALKCRAQQPWYVRDEDELLRWAEATDPENLVQVKKSVKWSEIKQYGKAVGEQLFDPATGEVIPGVTVIHREPKFTVEVE